MHELDEYSVVKFNVRSSEREKLRLHQERDSILAEVMQLVKRRVKPLRHFKEKWYVSNFRRLLVRGNILYRTADSEAIDSPVLQAVIPDTLVKEVMEDMHGSKFAGHPCAKTMTSKLKRYATWPSMGRDISNFVTNCVICDKVWNPVPGNRTRLQPIVAENVFDHVICDLLKLPAAPGNYNYLLVFKEAFSGYVSLYKLRDKRSEGVPKAFEDTVCKLGVPRRLTSDNRGEFCLEVMDRVCKVLGVKKGASVAYRPH
jgi:hypothetical protein